MTTVSKSFTYDYLPEDNHRYALFYEDSTIHTLDQGIRILNRVSNPILRYRQYISIQNPFMDQSYKGLIKHNVDQGILSIRFPSKCIGIGHIQNNSNCRMVSYYRHAESGYVREIQITPLTTIDVSRNPEMELIVYTNFEKKLIVSFDVYLQKYQTPRSAL